MLRKILAVVAGVVAGGIVIALAEMVGHAIYPLPAGMNPRDPQAIAEYVRTAPAGALISVLVGWALGAFVAGIVATLIARATTAKFALIAGGVLLLFAIINLVMIPGPMWFRVVGVLEFLPMAWLGSLLVRPRASE